MIFNEGQSMRFYRLILVNLLIMIWFNGHSQNSTIQTDEKKHEYGDLENIYTLKSEFIIANKGSKKLYLLRADADKEIKILAHKKTIATDDTTLIEVFFQPTKTGKFSKQIKLITSADAEPFVLEIQGNIKSLKADDKTACYYFKKPHKTHNPTTAVIDFPVATNSQKPFTPKDTTPFIVDTTNETVAETPLANFPVMQDESLNRIKYKPNNIVFLLDVSRSMRDSSKLPLLKKSILAMIDNLRDIDKISIITYADSILLKCEAYSGTEREQLKQTLDPLYAKGYTRGAKAILFSLDIALKNYIDVGNNQLFLATDGKFTFSEAYQKEWMKKTMGKDVVLSVVALGKDEEAMKNLQNIALIGKGSFIKIQNFERDKNLLLDEIKLRSERK